jgi:hypothetical protein
MWEAELFHADGWMDGWTDKTKPIFTILQMRLKMQKMNIQEGEEKGLRKERKETCKIYKIRNTIS